MIFHWLVLAVGVAAGAIAAVSGFGIGSVLTPLFIAPLGMRLAVAFVSLPHVVGAVLRLWLLRAHVSRRLLLTFGVASAAGGLAGAALSSRVSGGFLTGLFAALLIFAGVSGLARLTERMRFGRRMAWLAGAVSGLFGGLVGNQGGIRSAALMGFDVPKEAFVATATAVGIIVDAARIPVYFATELRTVPLGGAGWLLAAFAAAGVVLGTVAGARVLRRMPEKVFRPIVSALILALGLYMLTRVAG
jgi:uncharacterized protein